MNTHPTPTRSQDRAALTPAPTAGATDDSERGAFNTAFHELGLRWYWDRATWQALSNEPSEHARVRQHLVQDHSHLLSVYDADALTSTIVERKQRCRATASTTSRAAWPQFGWADARWGEIGV